MTAFIGTPTAIAAQRRLRDRQPDIAKAPHLCNGARILHFLDPDITGWHQVAEIANAETMMEFPMVDQARIIRDVQQHLGPTWQTPAWHALIGGEDQVLSACQGVTNNVTLPDDWEICFHDYPSEEEITEIQTLNAQTGVSPYPAYYMRSEAVPVLTVTLKNAAGIVVATASVADRYHPDSRLGGHVFAGMVSVDPEHRGTGLGKCVNALALQESHRRFGWTHATEQVAANNIASLAMIIACGLDRSAGLSSVATLNTGEAFSR